jgi:hypothetical protein
MGMEWVERVHGVGNVETQSNMSLHQENTFFVSPHSAHYKLCGIGRREKDEGNMKHSPTNICYSVHNIEATYIYKEHLVIKLHIPYIVNILFLLKQKSFETSKEFVYKSQGHFKRVEVV